MYLNKKKSSVSFSWCRAIMSSITVTLTGKTSNLSTNFYPEIVLDERFDYSCGLLDFYTYNYIPNVTDQNNRLAYSLNHYTDGAEVNIPIGSYEIDEILQYINKHFAELGVFLEVETNKNTFKCAIRCDENIKIYFTDPKSIGKLLGFDGKDLTGQRLYVADHPINIQNLNTIRIDCDLTTGSFHNGQSTHTIYEFSPTVNPGYKINEQPTNLIYLPITRRTINTLNVRIVDQNGELVDFRGENITCRIHIKKDI